MKNKNSTRRSFGRRALAFGIAMFAMVTLTAVGFAAWLISSNATSEGDGGIKTETVTQANIKITINNLNENGELTDGSGNKYDIVYSLPKDATGLVTFQENGGQDKGEQLGFEFTGSVEHWERVGTLKFTIRVPDCIVTAAGLTKSGSNWTYNAKNAYIQLPEYAMDKDGNALPKVVNGSWDQTTMTAPVQFTNISDANAILSATLGNGSIVITAPTTGTTATFAGSGLAFGWGARYNHVNPATTFNSNDWTNIANTDITRDLNDNNNYESYIPNQVALELLKLQAIVNGVKLDDYVTAASINLGGKTIDAYVKEATNSQTVASELALVQTKMSEVVYGDSFNKPTYKLYIEAIVR